MFSPTLDPLLLFIKAAKQATGHQKQLQHNIVQLLVNQIQASATSRWWLYWTRDVYSSTVDRCVKI